MTKKHFEAIADFIRTEVTIQGITVDTERMATGMARVCREANSRFDADRFYRACRLPHLAAN
jgi:hypothetical protein